MSRTVLDDFEYYLSQMLGKTCALLFSLKTLYFCINLGARRYLMKEPDSSIPACKRRLLKIMIVDRVLRVILFGFIFYKIFKKYNFFGFGEFAMEKHNGTIIERI